MILFCFIFLFSQASSASIQQDYREYAPDCKTENLKILNECLKSYLQYAVKHSSSGYKKLSIPPLDPHVEPKVTLSMPGGVVVSLKNISQSGFSKSLIKDVQFKKENQSFVVEYKVPTLLILGDYDFVGKLFSVPIVASGKFNITIIELQTVVKVQGRQDKNNSTLMEVTTVTVNMKPGKIKFRFNDLFKDSPETGNVINEMLNDDWERIFTRIKSKVEEESSQHARKLANKYFSKVPYDAIIPQKLQ